MIWDLEFRVWGKRLSLGVRVCGLGIGVKIFEVWDLGFRVFCLVVWSLEFWA